MYEENRYINPKHQGWSSPNWFETVVKYCHYSNQFTLQLFCKKIHHRHQSFHNTYFSVEEKKNRLNHRLYRIGSVEGWLKAFSRCGWTYSCNHHSPCNHQPYSSIREDVRYYFSTVTKGVDFTGLTLCEPSGVLLWLCKPILKHLLNTIRQWHWFYFVVFVVLDLHMIFPFYL